jgi:hypothetical protein
MTDKVVLDGLTDNSIPFLSLRSSIQNSGTILHDNLTGYNTMFFTSCNLCRVGCSLGLILKLRKNAGMRDFLVCHLASVEEFS